MIGRGLVTLLGVSVVVFIAIHLVPGNFVDVFVSADTQEDVKARLERTYGLDRPLPLQYVQWLGSTLSGDLGISLRSRQPVSTELGDRLPTTAELTFLALAFSIIVGIPLGIASAFAGRSFAGGLFRFIGAAGLSVPSFVLASLLVYVFSSNRLGLVVGEYVPLRSDVLANVRSMVLPAVALSVFTMALVLRTTRDSVLSVLPDLHIGAAVARGESRMEIVRRHVLRNAAIPVITVAAVSTGYLLGGAVVIETIFSIPGIGSYAVRAVSGRDYPVVLATVMIAATAFVTLNTLADLAYPLIDPRVRTTKSR